MVDLEIEAIFRKAQKCLELNPVIVLGSGASAAYGIPGMGGLAEHLVKNVVPSTADAKAWATFNEELVRVKDLELTLQRVEVSKGLLRQIIFETWKLIAGADHDVFLKSLENPHHFALSRLFRHLLNSTNANLVVVTPNYDCLAEYAANAAGFASYLGFSDGYLGYEDSDSPWTIYRFGRPEKTVNVWKVHGSIDWFRNTDVGVLRLPSVRILPTGFEPVIVTPGTNKYETTHQEPFRSVLSRADQALATASSYISIGYGFNDEHIQPKLIRGLKREKKPLVVLSRTLTESAKRTLLSGEISNFVAFELDGTKTRVYTENHLNGLLIGDSKLWDLSAFVSELTSY
jgi:hypothetical protein